MKNAHLKIVPAVMLLATIYSCNKSGESAYMTEESIPALTSDSISSAATMQVEGKQFIKTAHVNMDVTDVYDATVYIEKSLQELGGFVTSSRLRSHIISENTYNTSDEEAMMVRKFRTENTMQVRVPTENLGRFLTIINDKKLFLNNRDITAEDVTANIKLAEMETVRNATTKENIAQMKTDIKKVTTADDNMSEGNLQKVAALSMEDQLKYSTVSVNIQEPQIRISEIAVTNSRNVDNSYKINFFYDLKNAMAEGFYMIQKIIIGLTSIWPLVLAGMVLAIIIRKRKSMVRFNRKQATDHTAEQHPENF
ncbi:DUF4349 domain-containing protein [Chryseobacterium sp. MFBS3-17]|uniref:DUF4349 domain-containing protein n=1 Tax=Chryseobacterium sp. MFBS3-17 TaxID=2886689 RepID=UPI001D0E6EF2|nr:DUF4349 domain-containing protein [Chryseobacterium sp. MFBS3-17]MCC2590628.1 DUF4349 domain-containing protein [Chryseobacterium sp. MFBS3-17]